jgi:hypothetical protein
VFQWILLAAIFIWACIPKLIRWVLWPESCVYSSVRNVTILQTSPMPHSYPSQANFLITSTENLSYQIRKIYPVV